MEIGFEEDPRANEQGMTEEQWRAAIEKTKAPVCAACGERIEGTVAELLGEKMHPDCAQEIHDDQRDYATTMARCNAACGWCGRCS